MKTDSQKSSTTLTVRMRDVTKAKLEALADQTRRSKSFLANAAIERYLDRELDIVEGIHRGLAGMEVGRVVSHERALAEIDAAIDAAKGSSRG